MSRLIDADALLLALDKRKTYELADGRNRAYGKGVRDAMKDVDKQPTVDAVPIVRCYECKHSYRLGGTKILYQCDHNGVRPNYWFCADGEKVTE